MTAMNASGSMVRERAKTGTLRRPTFRFSDIWKAPLHDFPIRDEILYQYLPLSPEMDVLEIGPGAGFTAFRLARQVRSLTLLDVAAESVTRLRSALSSAGNIRFIAADVSALGLPEFLNARFDAVAAIEVFEYVSDLAMCLKNIVALLRPGGVLLAQFPNYASPKGQGLNYLSTGAELDEMMRSAGFENWSVYALKLRPHAEVLFGNLHERPLGLYRQFRRRFEQGSSPGVYDHTWAFQQGSRLEPFKWMLHCAWAALSAGMRLGGDCFQRTQLTEDILNRNLLVVAER